jgi:LmbE family N-acetylglucosaminyl deacetylase
VIAFTHGVRSHALTTIEKTRHAEAREYEQFVPGAIDDKEQEVLDACAVLGIRDVRFLRLDDDLLLVRESHVRAVARVIREVRPHVLITHSPFEMAGISVAHRACCEITLLAKGMAGGLMYGEATAPHTIPEIFFMWQHGETTLLDYVTPRFPAIIIDVTDVIEKKVRAMDCLKSQLYPGGLARKVLECCAAGHALHSCVPYGETFLRYYPDVQHYLPVSEHNLRIHSDPLEQTYARLGKMIAPFVPFEAGPR